MTDKSSSSTTAAQAETATTADSASLLPRELTVTQEIQDLIQSASQAQELIQAASNSSSLGADARTILRDFCDKQSKFDDWVVLTRDQWSTYMGDSKRAKIALRDLLINEKWECLDVSTDLPANIQAELLEHRNNNNKNKENVNLNPTSTRRRTPNTTAPVFYLRLQYRKEYSVSWTQDRIVDWVQKWTEEDWKLFESSVLASNMISTTTVHEKDKWLKQCDENIKRLSLKSRVDVELSLAKPRDISKVQQKQAISENVELIPRAKSVACWPSLKPLLTAWIEKHSKTRAFVQQRRNQKEELEKSLLQLKPKVMAILSTLDCKNTPSTTSTTTSKHKDDNNAGKGKDQYTSKDQAAMKDMHNNNSRFTQHVSFEKTSTSAGAASTTTTSGILKRRTRVMHKPIRYTHMQQVFRGFMQHTKNLNLGASPSPSTAAAAALQSRRQLICASLVQYACEWRQRHLATAVEEVTFQESDRKRRKTAAAAAATQT